jgi:hypothetical protein
MPLRPRTFLTVPLVLVLVGCGADAPTGTTSATTASPTAAASGPSDSGAPASESAESSVPPQTGQTDTEWGRIWDEVPAGFPRYPGSTTADDATPDPASDRYVVSGAEAQQIATWMQGALETATFTTEALSGPFEDGSLVLDSVGDAGCRIQTTIAPLGGMTFVTVLYGAACPAG